MCKKIYSILLVSTLVLCFSITSVFAADNSTVTDNEGKTLEVLEDELNDYILEKHPDIVIGSAEYVDFLTCQLMFETDKDLMKKQNYDDLMFFAGKFLECANNPAVSQEVKLNDGTVVIKLKNDLKQKKVSNLKAEIQLKNKLEENDVATLTDKPAVSPLAATSFSSKAVEYAHDYANSYNTPAYEKFSSDCTNFVSQCVVAGGKSMNAPSNYKTLGSMYKTTSYWYSKHWTEVSPYHRYGISSSFANVGDFYNYWKTRGALVETGLTKSELQSKAKLGDIVQLKNSSGSWFHSIIITGGSKGAWKYCGHSDPRNDAPISGISTAVEYRILRFA